MVKALLKAGANIEASGPAGGTALHRAALAGNVATAKELVNWGADVHAVNVSEQTPLHICAEQIPPVSGSTTTAMIMCLLDAGANINAPEYMGWSPLHSAVSSSNLEAIEALLAARANVDAKAVGGATPLHFAVPLCPTITGVLLAGGANPNARTNRDETPLHRAVEAGEIQTVEALLAYGAAATAKTTHGLTALHFLRGFGVEEALKLRVLIAAGADITAQTRDGSTPIHFSAANMDAALITEMVLVGADINAKDNDGNTPLHAVVFPHMLPSLLAAGADPTARNEAGETPLIAAEKDGKADLATDLRRITPPDRQGAPVNVR